MSEHFNKLLPPEAERLAYLIEEMSEAQHMACKVLRHGYNSTDPTVRIPITNRQLLGSEISDVLTAINMMIGAGDVLAAADHPKKRYFHHQE